MFIRLARPLEIALGVLFVISSVAKALDVHGFAVQVAAYGVVREPTLVIYMAYAVTVIESLLGIALLAGLRLGGLTLLVTIALLTAFTLLIAYAWKFKGLADCGCFGSFVKVGPGASILKNIVFLLMAVLIWRARRPSLPAAPAEDTMVAIPPPSEAQIGRGGFALGLIGALIVAVAFAAGVPRDKTPGVAKREVKDKSRPFAGFKPDLGGAPVDLSRGEFFVAMLSATCEHCRAVTLLLNDLVQTPEVPQIAALMLGTDDEMKEFKAVTAPQFPIQAIDALKFMSLLGDGVPHPPSFYIIRDGAPVRHFAADEPTYEQLFDFATQDNGQSAPDDKAGGSEESPR